MKNTEFKVNLSVKETYELIKDNDEEFADLLESEVKTCCEDKEIAIMVYEKYFIRVNSRASLVVIIDNFEGYTKVKAIASGGGNGVHSNFDWGTSDSFEIGLQKLLLKHMIKKDH